MRGAIVRCFQSFKGFKMTTGKILAGVAIAATGVLVAGMLMAATRKSIDFMGYIHSGYDS